MKKQQKYQLDPPPPTKKEVSRGLKNAQKKF